MTKEETIKSALKFLVHKQQEQGSWGYADNNNTNEVSWNEVLEWIDQRSCGDLISREELTKKLEYLCDCLCDYSKRQREFMCDACKLGAVIDAVEELSSVEPERKTGKWIEGKKTPGYTKWNCSECGLLVRNPQKPWYEYCPNCGARMEVDG